MKKMFASAERPKSNTVLDAGDQAIIEVLKKKLSVPFHPPSCCVTCFFPCCADDSRYYDVQSYMKTTGRKFHIQYSGTYVRGVEVETRGPFKPDSEKVPMTLKYSTTGWFMDGVLDQETAMQLNSIDKKMSPVLNCCQVTHQQNWCPEMSIAEIICCLIWPCATYEFLTNLLCKGLTHFTAPCWSCCSASRVNSLGYENMTVESACLAARWITLTGKGFTDRTDNTEAAATEDVNLIVR